MDTTEHTTVSIDALLAAIDTIPPCPRCRSPRCAAHALRWIAMAKAALGGPLPFEPDAEELERLSYE